MINKILIALLLALLPFLANAVDYSKWQVHPAYEAGVEAREAGDLELAFRLFKEAYEDGNVDGAAAYGEALYYGRGAAPNPKGAAEPLKYAADGLSARGLYMYAKTLYPDGPAQIPLLQTAAEWGEVEAIEELAFLYSGYQGVSRNYDIVQNLTRRASAAGSPNATATMVGWAMDEWDLDEAARLLHRTIELGGAVDRFSGMINVAKMHYLCLRMSEMFAKQGLYANRPWPRQPEKAEYWAGVAMTTYQYQPPPSTPGFKVPEISKELQALLDRADEVREARYWKREMEKARQTR